MNTTLTIVADAHILGAASAFTHIPGYRVSLRLLEAPEITPDAVRDADVLITRSSTRVDASLLEGSRVRFAATATIGDDHYDKAWLAANGIEFANAAGSSTGSVVEYMITLLLELHQQNLIRIPDTCIGVIGAGRIGSRVARVCEQMGMRVLINDPPRARREGQAGFSELDELLARADILTLHTPLTRSGPDATHHLLNAARLNAFHGFGVLNAARGACLDNAALLDWLNADNRRFAALDCWEHEPAPDAALLAHERVAVATPHIAGHSLDGKAANTWFAYRALCRWLKVEPVWRPESSLPPPPSPITVACAQDLWRDLHTAATALYDIRRDDAAMRRWQSLDVPARSAAFTRYRRHYPERRAWDKAPLRLDGATAETRDLAHALGMNLV